MTNDREVDEAVIITEYHDFAEVTRSSAAVIPGAFAAAAGHDCFATARNWRKGPEVYSFFPAFSPWWKRRSRTDNVMVHWRLWRRHSAATAVGAKKGKR